MNQVVVISAYRQLSPVERKFVDTYVQRLEQAANRANERISNALHRPIPQAVIDASRGMLDIPLVNAAIAERINEIATATELTVTKIIKELSVIAFGSIANFMQFDEYGLPIYDFTNATPEQLSTLKSWEETPMQFGGKKYKFQTHDKMKALELLAKFTGILEADNPHWIASNQKPTVEHVTHDESLDDVANRYAELIEG